MFRTNHIIALSFFYFYILFVPFLECSLVARWRLNGNMNPEQSSGVPPLANYENGVLNNPYYTHDRSGVSNSVLQFNTADYVKTTDNIPLPTGDAAKSMCLWMKLTLWSSEFNVEPWIFYVSPPWTPQTNELWAMSFRRSDMTLQFDCGNDCQARSPSLDITPDSWVHVWLSSHPHPPPPPPPASSSPFPLLLHIIPNLK